MSNWPNHNTDTLTNFCISNKIESRDIAYVVKEIAKIEMKEWLRENKPDVDPDKWVMENLTSFP
jgi:hypothetical protein